MSANFWLIQLLLFFWGGIWVLVKSVNVFSGRGWKAGPSLVPIIPLCPTGLFILGWTLNLVAAPWGTWAVVAAHVAIVWYHFSNRKH